MDILIYIVIGAIAGLASGMLGLGGGILVVPGLLIVFAHMAIPKMYIMHLAAGTSFSVMIITTLSSALSHYRRGSVDRSLLIILLPGMLLGVIAGAVLAHFLDSFVLRMIFGSFLVLIGIQMFRQSFLKPKVVKEEPASQAIPKFLRPISVFVGMISGALGVGPGSMLIPYLTHKKVPMRRSIGTVVALALPIAIVGAITFALTGLGAHMTLAYRTGYIYWPAFVVVAAGSMVFAPIGAKVSYIVPSIILKRIFTVLLFVLAIHLLIGF
jgi:uncharacterized protein